ncbi:MAG: T9SS type A sorting domain-containing protein [Bacteroidia bacterium]|nr:T9SS type A sorting domain-containing protein [Bacteroidia bacterium]
MKKIYLSLLLSLALSFYSRAQKFEWLYANTTNQSLGYENPKVKTDPWGNTFILGRYNGWMVHGNDSLLSFGNGAASYFLTKLDPSGNRLWSKTFSPHNSGIEDMCIDGNGYVYATIYCNGFITYNDGDTSFTFPNVVSLNKIVSFDNNGKVRWGIESPQGTSWQPLAASLQASGFYTASGNKVCKIDTTGSIVWTKTASTTDFYFRGLECNDNGTLAATGVTFWNAATVTLDTVSFTIVNPSSGPSSDIAVLRMDTSGSVHWAHVLPNLLSGSTYSLQQQMLVNSASEIYILYNKPNSVVNYVFANDTIFNPYCPTCQYGAVLKLSSGGVPLWASGAVYGNSHLSVVDFILNDNEDIILTGEAASVTYFGNHVFNNNYGLGSYQTFYAAKVLANGNYSWFKSDSRIIGQLVYDTPYGIAKGLNNTYIVMGSRNLGLAPAFQLGCLSDSNPNEGFFAVNISENTEPVPVVTFELTQSANKIVAKNTTQNATSISWSFGDGTPASSLEEPYHVYADPGVYNLCLSAYNNCGMGSKCMQVVVKGLRAIITDRGSNDGVVTTDIFGGGFTPATTVLLKKSGNADIVPYFTHYVDPGKLQVRLNLIGQSIGAWDVEVTVPGDTVMALINGFTVEPAQDYFFEIVNKGTTASRPNRWFPSQFQIHNKTSKDAAGVVVLFRVDNWMNTYINTSFTSAQQIPFLNSGYQYLVSNGLNTSLTGYNFEDTSFYSDIGALVIPLIKANSFFEIPLYLVSSIQGQTPKVMTVSGTWLEPASLLGTYTPSNNPCFGEYLKRAIEKTFSISVPASQWNNCFPALFDSLKTVAFNQANNPGSNATAFSLPAGIVSILSSMASSGCITGIPPVLTEAQIKTVFKYAMPIIADSAEFSELNIACSEISSLRQTSGSSEFSENRPGMGGLCLIPTLAGLGVGALGYMAGMAAVIGAGVAGVGIVGGLFICHIISISIDPNAISGLGNNADDIYLKSGVTTSYTISFENADTATAPAQVVIITDTLDANRFDFRSFRFGDVIIGENLKFSFDSPDHSQIQISSLAPVSNDFLRTEAVFDSTSGVIKWIFTTVSPVNYQPVTGALSGFLPPNVNGTEGTGYVSYEANLKSSLVTGDSINNVAQIFFDENAPITTNNWLNIIDIDKPLSAVNALPPNINTTSFTVSWGGSDFISGIHYYDIYVSENDQPWKLWLAVTDTFQYTFNGVNGSKYEFISIATDRARNEEAPPFDPANNPDAVTTIVLGIEENMQNGMLTLFPNPVKDVLAVYGKNLSGKIRIMDALGRNVYQKEINTEESPFLINTSSFTEGVYVIELHSVKGRVFSKFIKQ